MSYEMSPQCPRTYLGPQTKIIGQSPVAHDQLSLVIRVVEKGLVRIYYVAAGCCRLESIFVSGREGVNIQSRN